jgi:hypothetical protein
LDGIKKLKELAKMPNAAKLVGDEMINHLCPLIKDASQKKRCITAATTAIELTIDVLKAQTPMFVCSKLVHLCKPTLEVTEVSGITVRARMLKLVLSFLSF